jgi:hypothetical protein
MRTAIAFLFFLTAGSLSTGQEMQSYTPDRKTNDAPTFVNAEVVRVNRDNTATFRSESGEITLTADEDTAPGMLSSLHAGDKVLVEYRETTSPSGRVVRYVTSVKAASPTSGEPGRGRIVAARLTPGSTVRARVLSYDKRGRRVAVIDESGGLRTLPVRSGLGGLDALVPGANVAFNLGGTAGAVNVSGITPLGTTPIFASGNTFPAINGQFVSFNSQTGLLTLDTTTGGRMTFPVSTAVAAGLPALRRGDTLSFGFDVTGGQPRLGTSNFTPAPVATVTGFQPLTAGAGAVGVMPAGLPAGQNVGAVGASNTVGGVAVGNAAGPGGATVPGGTGTVGGFAVGGTTGAGSAGVGTAAGAGTTGATGSGNVATTGGQVGGGGVVGGGVVGSPFGNTVPSLPGATPTATAVLPPAGAKEPLSADEVGRMRAQGERDLDAAAVSLAAAAAGIDPVWAGFKNQCLSGFTVSTVTAGREWYLLVDDRIPSPDDDGCRAMHADLTGRARGFLSQLQTVEDAARKADVLPVRVREVFERHKLR